MQDQLTKNMWNGLEKAIELIDELFWDYDRLSRDGQSTLNQLADIIGLDKADDRDGS